MCKECLPGHFQLNTFTLLFLKHLFAKPKSVYLTLYIALPDVHVNDCPLVQHRQHPCHTQCLQHQRMVHRPTSLSPQEIYFSAYLAMDMGLGDVKHHEFSNLHNLKIQNVLHASKIFFSLFAA